MKEKQAPETTRILGNCLDFVVVVVDHHLESGSPPGHPETFQIVLCLNEEHSSPPFHAGFVLGPHIPVTRHPRKTRAATRRPIALRGRIP